MFFFKENFDLPLTETTNVVLGSSLPVCTGLGASSRRRPVFPPAEVSDGPEEAGADVACGEGEGEGDATAGAGAEL